MLALLLYCSVWINELMADPLPAVALPAFEYVELYNVSSESADLTAWRLQCGRNTYVFPACIMEPGGFLLLCAADAVPALEAFGPVLPLWTTSTALANAGQTVALFNAADELQCSVSYDMSWYRDTRRKQGGWSLELVVDWTAAVPADVPAVMPASLWRASAHPSGGTPGAINSWCIGEAGASPDLWADPAVCSPDGDGWQDRLEVHYRLPEADFHMILAVFDRRGILLRRICTDALALREGCVVWDGCDGQGRPLPDGIYLLWMQAYHDSGQVFAKKMPVVISR